MRFKFAKICLAVLPALMFMACHTPKNIAYFQDAEALKTMSNPEAHTFKLRPGDKINIVVNSKDARLEQLFSLTAPSFRNTIGATSTATTVSGKSTTSSYQTIAYTVSDEGNIDFPVLGEVKVEGMTRQQVASTIKQKLIAEDLVKDPVVTVEYVNLSVSVLGEVTRAGRFDIVRDYYTVLDAISQAGDLTINGQRENVMVMRKEGDQQKVYTINLCSMEDMLKSPAFYLQQDDVVYVTPNDKRKRESTVSGNAVLTPSFWISVTSLLSTITAVVLSAVR